jgi:hypothetical protein
MSGRCWTMIHDWYNREFETEFAKPIFLLYTFIVHRCNIISFLWTEHTVSTLNLLDTNSKFHAVTTSVSANSQTILHTRRVGTFMTSLHQFYMPSSKSSFIIIINREIISHTHHVCYFTSPHSQNTELFTNHGMEMVSIVTIRLQFLLTV